MILRKTREMSSPIAMEEDKDPYTFLLPSYLRRHKTIKSTDDTISKSGNHSMYEIASASDLEDETLQNNSSCKTCNDSSDSSVEVCKNYLKRQENGNELCPRIPENASMDSEDSLADEDIELPSNVRNRKQIFMPLDLKVDDPRVYGKWLWFTNGDVCRQDYVWIQLQNLILNGLVILLESSTARKCVDRGRYQGVIKCYTRGDKETIKLAGITIQKITKDNSILHYKTNQASKDSRNRTYGDRFITQYMLTASGKFYEKDELDRWKQVQNIQEGNFISGGNNFCSPYRRETESLPSEEYGKRRYIYPVYSNLMQFDHFWSLFCNVTDFDNFGMTELDRTWVEAKRLRDEGVFTMVSCETYSVFTDNQLRRSVTCVVGDYYNLDRLIASGDKLRERASHDFPMYMKVCTLNHENIKRTTLKYMYTEDRDLYEYVDEDWKLLKRVW